jgi:phosphodiesterase/alkaline phosphatase D-like protein
MNQNIIIGIVVVLVVLVGGYYVVTSMNAAPGTQTATTTPTTQTATSNPTTVIAGAPNVVTDTNVEPTNSTAVVTGAVTPNGAPTTYWYEYGQSATLGNKTSSQMIGSGFSTIHSPAYITGLSANTTYYFRLDAQNSFGTVSGNISTFSTNNNPPSQGTPPSASTNAATSLMSTSANLNGHMDPHSSQTTYWFEYGSNPNLGQITTLQSGGGGNSSIAVLAPISGLNPKTMYYFRIDAQNQFGTVNGATQSFTTSGPVAIVPVVTTQIASLVATTTATVRGTVNPYGFQTTYWFEYSTNSNFGSSQLHSTAQQSAGVGTNTVSVEANISALRSGTTYYFRIVAQNSAGTVRGDSLSFKTK